MALIVQILAGPNSAKFVSPGVFDNQPISPAQQRQIDISNWQWQCQQIQIAVAKAAAQAAAYAQKVAPYNNEAAKQTAVYAAQAAQAAHDAQIMNLEPLNYLNSMHAESVETRLKNDAAQAAQAATLAAQAAAQAEIASTVAKLEHERDESIANLKAKSTPIISDLESQISTLKAKAAQLENQMSQAERENAHLRAKQLFQPKDPWRLLDGQIHNAKELSWVQFTGKVLEVRPNGLLVHGDFGPPLEAGFGERDYFVDNFPNQTYPMADGERITSTMHFVAHLDEKSSVYQFTNTTIDLRVNTVRRLDYGKIVATPPPDLAQRWNSIVIAGDSNQQITKQLNDNDKEQTALESQIAQLNSDFYKERETIFTNYAAKIKAVPNPYEQQAQQIKDIQTANQKKTQDRALKYNQDQADKGDPIGLLRMGERYRDGEGVEKDLAKARDYLTKATAAGSPTAADELKNFPSN